jgi:hypothetical protein
MEKIDLTRRIGSRRIHEFVAFMKAIQAKTGFRMSSRGWAYILEQHGHCTKDQFDKVQDIINRARAKGLLPVDFVREDLERKFLEVHKPTDDTYGGHIASWIGAAEECDRYYKPDWWEGEEYYIQVIVEKVDLIDLFRPICEQYHIPLANGRGWSSILQRADYCRRFAEAEERGLRCVLLYCGDHDPDGLLISETLRKNLFDIKDVVWSDGFGGYDPTNLIIERFGLDYEFIMRNNLTWIDNLITGSGVDLGNPRHPNHNQPYVQDYLKKYGRRKCEANALVIAPEEGRQLFREKVIEYLGEDALDRFAERRRKVRSRVDYILDESGARETLRRAMEQAENFDDSDYEDND